jgi:glycosyltransferase involved in cell wall biosynthesis
MRPTAWEPVVVSAVMALVMAHFRSPSPADALSVGESFLPIRANALDLGHAEIVGRRLQGAAVTGLISVILTTYRREDALDAVLRGLRRQVDRGFEIIVADDGSGPDTRALVERSGQGSDLALKHVWHEDRGFRAGEIRNRGILASSGSYCIFLDGDCIPRPDFVAVHRALAEPGWFVTGNRILMSRALTERVLADASTPEMWGFGRWLALRRRRDINRLAPLLPLPLGPLRKLRARAWRGARSCNLAVWRRDLDSVDGFDAAYSGWGLEDSDLLIRLLHAGVRRKDGNFATGVLHLWHPENDRSRLPDNQQRLDAIERSDRVRAIAGMSALAGAVQPVS